MSTKEPVGQSREGVKFLLQRSAEGARKDLGEGWEVVIVARDNTTKTLAITHDGTVNLLEGASMLMSALSGLLVSMLESQSDLRVKLPQNPGDQAENLVTLLDAFVDHFEDDDEH